MKNRYTDKELTFLKENYKTLTVKQMSEKIDRSVYSISAKLSELGLCKQPHKSWTNEECEFLKTNYMNMTNSEIAKILDRPFNSISSQMDKLGLVRAKPWSKEDEDYLRDNFANMTHKQIGAALNRTDSAVRAKCFDLGLYKKNEPWTEYELSFLRDNYREMSDRELSAILNRSENAIHLQASRMGMKKYPYFCNYHYFENIDTEEKAYWLGFLVADGWISKNEESNAGVIGIELQYGDINHLKKFNKSIGGNYRITDRWRTCSMSKYKDKKNHMCVIRIFSLTMLNSLLNLGFTNQKTYDYKIPHIKKDLLRHFIRGYFDGDGCFTFTNKTFSISFPSASKDLRDDLYTILSNIGLHSSQRSGVSEFDTPMYFIDIYRQKDKIKFLDYIYKDCTIYLDRKYKKYLKVKEKYDTTKSLAA